MNLKLYGHTLFVIIMAFVMSSLLIDKNIVESDTTTTNWKNGTYSAWSWGNPIILTPIEIQNKIDFAVKMNISTLYLDTTQYTKMRDKGVILKDSSILRQYYSSVKNVIKLANSKNIKVEGLIAGNEMANPTNVRTVFDTLNFIRDFNAQSSFKFSGFHLDVEFYNQLNYRNNQQVLGENFLKMVTELITRVNQITTTQTDFSLNFDISSTLDGTGDWGYITFNSTKKPLTFHLMDLLENSKNPFVTIMAYRNIATGNNSSVSLSKDEFDYIEKKGLKTRIWVGQETDNTDPNPTVSYYDKSLNYTTNEFGKILSSFKDKISFAGIAVHTLESYQKLK